MSSTGSAAGTTHHATSAKDRIHAPIAFSSVSSSVAAPLVWGLVEADTGTMLRASTAPLTCWLDKWLGCGARAGRGHVT